MKIMASLNLSKYINNSQDLINRRFLGACRRGDFEVVKLLLAHKDIKFKPELESLSQEVFQASAYSGNLELFKYLEEVYKNNNFTISLPSLGMVCEYSSHELIGYVCQYYQSKAIDSAFYSVLVRDQVETFVYLLGITGRKFSQMELEVFFKAIVEKGYGSSENMLLWMFLEENLLITDDIKKWLYEQPSKVNSIKAINILEKIELKNKMEKSFGDKATIQTKSKI